MPGSRQRRARSSSVKGIHNLQEGRHALARKICHGKKGEPYHCYERGLKNQLVVLGLVVNCVVL
jgi:TnpA family transposase